MYFMKIIFYISALLIAPIIANGNEEQRIILDEVLLKTSIKHFYEML